MADTTTPVYSFVLPEVDGSDGTWGTKLNANLTALDGLLSGSTNLQNASFTGTVSFGGSTGTAGQVLKSQGAGANAIWTDDTDTTYTAGSGLSLTGTEFANTAPDQTVVLTAGASISVSGTYPSFTITNDAPDQTVSLTGAGTTTVSGTYPNFTITGAGTTYTAGSGLSLTGTEFANTAPDQTVALTGAGATSISGTYPNFTITSTDTVYTLPFTDNSSNWDTAFGWGNHASAGYLTSHQDISGKLDSSAYTAADVLAKILTVDGAGSGLDADLLDGYNSAENGASTIHRLANNGYSQLQNWTNIAGSGIYSSTTNNAHFSPNTATTYATWQSSGSKGGYDGILFDSGGDVAVMYDGSGNGGLYRQADSRWHIYHHVANNCLAVGHSTTSSTYELYVHGDIYATGNITAYSDARIKENVVTIDSALEKVESMRGVYYNKIDDPDKTKEVGFIAQEVNEVIPEAVTYAEDTDQYGVKYANITALLVESVKELSQQVKDLQAEVKELKENGECN